MCVSQYCSFNFINDSAIGDDGGAIYTAMFYLESVEPTTLSTIQQYLVVQSPHQGILYLASMEPTTSTTQQTMVELSLETPAAHLY